jgi:hypothetical protein
LRFFTIPWGATIDSIIAWKRPALPAASAYCRLSQRRAAKWRTTATNEADCGAIEERLARLERGVKRGKRAATPKMVRQVFLIAWSVAKFNNFPLDLNLARE